MEYYNKILLVKWKIENKQLDFLQGKCSIEEVMVIEREYREILAQKDEK